MVKTVPCTCGDRKKYVKNGIVTIEINDHPITIIGVPHYECFTCGNMGYPTDSPIEGILRYAYKEGFTTVVC